MSNEVFRFDAESWCVVHCRLDSDVVQMTSNIADEVLANQHAQNVRLLGGHVFRVCKAGVLVAALELIKTDQDRGLMPYGESIARYQAENLRQ